MSIRTSLLTAFVGSLSLQSCMLTKEDLLEALGQLDEVKIAVEVTPAPTSTPSPTLSPELQATVDRVQAAVDDAVARQLIPDNPIMSTQFATTSFIADGAFYGRDDPAIRHIGARFLNGINYPGRLFAFPYSVTYTTTTDVGGTGINRGYRANEVGHEFLLPADVGEFEIVSFGSGAPGNFHIDIDGVGTNASGYPSPPHSTGAIYNYNVRLQPASVARRIRIWTNWRPFGGVRLPNAATLGTLPAPSGISAVFVGDSITEGAGASDRFFSYPVRLAYQLGVERPVFSGLGASGYLAARPGENNFRQRINDVLTAVNGGPPDVLFVAGGLNDFSVTAAAAPFGVEQTGAQALAYFQELRAAAPGMLIVVVGPWTVRSFPTYSEQLVAGRNALFAAAAQVPGVLTIDVSGAVTASNVNMVFGSGDGVHPVDFGHQRYADTITAGLRHQLSAL